jgi:hypothetical protein
MCIQGRHVKIGIANEAAAAAQGSKHSPFSLRLAIQLLVSVMMCPTQGLFAC